MRILHTNDLHGRLSRANLATLLTVRETCDLYFDSGDVVKAGNLGIPLRPEEAWPLLAEAHCTASVPGNRESHVLEAAWRAKTAGLAHTMLCANMRDRSGNLVLPASMVVGDIGTFGIMVPMVTKRMATQAASAFLWDPPVEAAKAAVAELRPRVSHIFCLSHIGYSQDRLLAEACPGIDVIFGGHSHTVLERPVQVGQTWIVQGGSHARFMGVYEWDGVDLTGGLIPWG